MSNPADAVNARQDKLREEYIARDLERVGGRRAKAVELKSGDRFVIPLRTPGTTETAEKVVIGKQDETTGRQVVIYKTSDRVKSQWLPGSQDVIIL